MPGIKRFPLDKFPDYSLKFLQILSSFAHPPDIFTKLSGLREKSHFSQLSNISFKEPKNSTSSPFRLLDKVLRVNSFGI